MNDIAALADEIAAEIQRFYRLAAELEDIGRKLMELDELYRAETD